MVQCCTDYLALKIVTNRFLPIQSIETRSSQSYDTQIKEEWKQQKQRDLPPKYWLLFSVDFLHSKSIITGLYHSAVLPVQCNAITKKRTGNLRRRALLVHDNQPTHTSKVSKATTREQIIIELLHPLYILDLASSDFYMF